VGINFVTFVSWNLLALDDEGDIGDPPRSGGGGGHEGCGGRPLGLLLRLLLQGGAELESRGQLVAGEGGSGGGFDGELDGGLEPGGRQDGGGSGVNHGLLLAVDDLVAVLVEHHGEDEVERERE